MALSHVIGAGVVGRDLCAAVAARAQRLADIGLWVFKVAVRMELTVIALAEDPVIVNLAMSASGR